jgi:hypothetical protein
VTLVLGAVVLAGGIFFGRLIAGSIRGARARRAASRRPVEGEPAAERADPLAGFPCHLGDVVVRRGERDEAWLAGALVLREDRPVAVLFVAPEAREDRALFVRDGAMTWLAPFAGMPAMALGEPPHAIEHEGALFQRTRRLPVHVERLGTGTPAIGERAVVGEYSGLGAERVVVIAGTQAVAAWRGVALSEDDYDVLPGGNATLE